MWIVVAIGEGDRVGIAVNNVDSLHVILVTSSMTSSVHLYTTNVIRMVVSTSTRK